jgi:hypothetical protein
MVSDKTKEELESELQLEKALRDEHMFISECIRTERAISDKSYADKLVEVVVWGMVGTILTSVLLAGLALVVLR